MQATPERNGLRALAVAAAVLLGFAWAAAPALASHSQIAIMQDDTSLLANPGPTLQEMRHLGVEMVRVTVRWSYIAPAPTSRRRPHFNATNPSAYPSGNWAPYDAIVRDAHADRIKVLFDVTAFAPYWAEGANPGRYKAHYRIDEAFEPSASAYGQFVQAVGTRYGGTFRPAGSVAALPRVSAWEIYNEPNFGEDLAPQAIDHSQVLWAPVMWRSLLNAAWGALRGSGHGSDTKVVGALAARGGHFAVRKGYGLPGTYGETPPLEFIRDLYCVDRQYHPYRGAAAAVRMCPTTAAASRHFRAQNPGLFSPSGWSIHPYQLTRDANAPPDSTRYHDPDFVALSQLPNMARTLDRIQRVYGSGKRFPIWNDEYGYITDPPVAEADRGCGCHFVSPATAAAYMNWAEYILWVNPRIASTSQYLLYDPNPTFNTPEYGGFASGLIYYPTVLGGQPKRTYFAYRLPIFMPKTQARVGNRLEVWGDVRPAPYAAADGDGAQYVQIQFQQSPGGQWITEKTVRVTDPHGYFETPVAFPSSGSVRIAWTYPPPDVSLASNLVTPSQTVGPGGYIEPLAPTTSRTVKITIT